ncbi:bifunctional TH2 protein, mitochondrial-like [Ipomoea triloba]|uniref:bifunctional TH2 protein, mitochondrial-like n=1 Tax=Ipomoea triloba TaxID=35885 RepID=UPI00125CEF5D|nr:bifunctional TH2 protein, mitochondrial-like [Ipomoea triloba]XP_031104799.1 bifunctional TH2 protein, mitochondrial-like [Ipomoea triloba]
MASASSSSSSKPPPVGNIPKLPRDEVVGIAKKCWNKFRKEATFALYTPFIVCLASGTLEVETFGQCVSQGVYFVKPFDQALEFAEANAEDDDAKHRIRELRKTTLDKLNLHHDSLVQEWGSDVVKDTTQNRATTKCTEFLLDTATGKLATPCEKTKLSAYTLGAVTSCIRLYAYIGKELQGLIDGKSNHRYKKWIENYFSDSFQEFSLQTEDLLDKLSVSLTGEELDIIEKLYSQGIKHEIDFFLAQPLIQKAVVPLLGEHNLEDRRFMIFSAFDLTCTHVDSCAILAKLAISTAPKSDQIRTENQIARMTLSDLTNIWEDLSKNYKNGYDQCIENILATEKAEKFDFEGLLEALEQLSDFEKKANLRVIESGLLKGLSLEDIKQVGGSLILQDGCMNFFQTVIKKDVDVRVLSSCWCGDLIRSAFSSGGLNDELKVRANELEFKESSCTGKIVKRVESPIDKLQAKLLVKNCGSDRKKRLDVYIGDSVGDLACLLEAYAGIVVGSNSSLTRLGTHFGVRFIPLFRGVVDQQKEREVGSGILYTASSWAEIHAFVIGS